MARRLYNWQFTYTVGETPSSTCRIYTDSACTALADIVTVSGAAIVNSQFSLVPTWTNLTFYGPDDVTTLYSKPTTAAIAYTLTTNDLRRHLFSRPLDYTAGETPNASTIIYTTSACNVAADVTYLDGYKVPSSTLSLVPANRALSFWGPDKVQTVYTKPTTAATAYTLHSNDYSDLSAGQTVDGAAAVASVRTLGTGALQAASGTDSRFGSGTVTAQGVSAAMSSGHVTVTTATATATAQIIVVPAVLGTVTAPKAVYVSARSAGVSFTVTSADATDTSTVTYLVVEPH
jgi:hypothetical protein